VLESSQRNSPTSSWSQPYHHIETAYLSYQNTEEIWKGIPIRRDLKRPPISNINPDSEEEEEEKHVFENTVDASFANSSKRRSYEGFIFKLYEDMIDWASRKQAIVFIFIIETKLLTLLHVDKTCIWWINFFNKLDFDYDHQVRIFNDNQQIIRILISEQLKITIKLLHVNVAQCWLRQSVQLRHLNVSYLQINQMTTNDLIKQLFSQKHRSFVKMLRLIDVDKLI
jgi:hypothetical protein